MESQFEPIREDISPQAREMIVMGRRALVDPKAGDAMMQMLGNAKSIAHAAALIVFKLIDRAEDDVGDVDPEEIYGDQGVGEYLMDAVFALAQQDEVPGADDQAQFSEALDLLEEFASGVFGLTNEQGDPNAAAPEGEQPAPAAAAAGPGAQAQPQPILMGG